VFDLDRFVKAQDPVIETVLRELRAGHKQTHWMWFVFPQLRGLGRSPMAQHYGIDSLDEARAYLGHAILGPRLMECVEAVMGVSGKTLHEIFFPVALMLNAIPIVAKAPVLVLIMRVADAWLATWSRADASCIYPIDPIRLPASVAELLRARLSQAV